MTEEISQIPHSLIGHAAESLVVAHAILGSQGRLFTFAPGVDVDHKDLIVDELGGYRSLYLQVKCATGADREGRLVCFADYPEGAVPESPRLVYVVCLLDIAGQALARCWLVPSAEFNRRAYRQHKAAEPGRVVLQFSCRLAGDPSWDAFELPPLQLGSRLLELVDSTPDQAPAELPGLLRLTRRS